LASVAAEEADLGTGSLLVEEFFTLVGGISQPTLRKWVVRYKDSGERPQQVSCTLRGDEARLHQIFANLLSNGLKFTPSEGSVTAQLRKVNASAVVVVKNTGKGITPEFLPHIFERFSQEEASAAENRGLGLGLPICKHLVELHGGSISAESEGLDRGAAIKVELPAIASRRPLLS
jgi:signal transduction histidine kinase